MAGGLEIRSGARRVTALALLTCLVCIPAAVVAARAPAGWQPVFSTSRSSAALRITGSRVSGLFPGARRTLTLTLHNSDSNRILLVRRVRVRDLRTSKRGCKPTRRNLTIRRVRARAVELRPGRSRRVVVLLRMPNTVADACQQAVFQLHFVAATTYRKRIR
jgi:hypothetical protein